MNVKWTPLDLNQKYTIHRQVLGDVGVNDHTRLNLWDYIVNVNRNELFLQDAVNGLSVKDNKVVLGGALNEHTFINGGSTYNVNFLSLNALSVFANNININGLTTFTSGTTGQSGVKFTNINSSTTPVTGQPLGVDSSGNIVVVNFSTPTCDDVELTVNTSFYKLLTCGVTWDINVIDEDNNPVGTIDTDNIIINNSVLQFNGSNADSILAEGTLNVLVQQGGSTFTGWTYNDVTKVLDIDSCPPADDVEINLNSTLIETVSPGDVVNLTTTLDGSPVSATYTSGVINVNNPTKSGYAPRVLGLPQQVTQVNAGDCGWAFAQGAFDYTIPYTNIGYQKLDNADPLGATLLYNNRFANKFRFTNLTGTGDSTTTVDVLCGDSVTRTASAFIDHLQGIVCFYISSTATWSTQCTRANGATYSTNPVYFASVDIATQLYVYQTGILSHIRRLGITIAAAGCFLGEAVAGTTNAYGISTAGVVSTALPRAGGRAALFFRKDDF